MATPRESIDIPASRNAVIKEMYTSGVYTQAEIADHFGISASSAVIRLLDTQSLVFYGG